MAFRRILGFLKSLFKNSKLAGFQNSNILPENLLIKTTRNG